MCGDSLHLCNIQFFITMFFLISNGNCLLLFYIREKDLKTDVWKSESELLGLTYSFFTHNVCSLFILDQKLYSQWEMLFMSLTLGILKVFVHRRELGLGWRRENYYYYHVESTFVSRTDFFSFFVPKQPRLSYFWSLKV